MSRYSLEELSSLSLKSLAEIGSELGLTFHSKQNKAKRGSMILAEYAARDISAAKRKRSRKSPSAKHADTSSVPIADSASPLLGERKPAFEKLASAAGEPVGPVGSDTADDPSLRGGIRPGAGRPTGMTDQLALYNSLPQQPHPAILEAFELLFKTWSTRAKCPAIVLTKEQAFELALPYTQMAELLGITQYIPAALMVGITCIWTTSNLVSAKAEIARAAMAQRKSAESVESATV